MDIPTLLMVGDEDELCLDINIYLKRKIKHFHPYQIQSIIFNQTSSKNHFFQSTNQTNQLSQHKDTRINMSSFVIVTNLSNKYYINK